MDNNIYLLYLNESDMIAAGVENMPLCINIMEEMFKLLSAGDYLMGGPSGNEHGIRVSFPKESSINGMPLSKPDYRFMAMPAYLGGKFHSFGIKTYGSNPANKEFNLPRSILMMQLLDVDSGVPLSYMSANILSAMRTGAVTGLGCKYFCNKDAKVLTIIGPGVMGKYALNAFMCCGIDFETIKIKGRGKSSLNKFVEYVKESYPSIKNIDICDSYEEACKDSDLIYYGTTNATNYDDNPFIEEKWVKEGATIISASALLVKPDFLKKCKLVADNYKMYEGWGAGNPYPTQKTVSTLLGMGFYDAVCANYISRSDIYDLGDILVNGTQVRESKKDIIMYSVGGMPVEDVAWAFIVYNYAKTHGIGKKLKLWDSSALV